MFSCDICAMSFTSKCFLRRHVQKHDGVNYSCDICNKVFTRECTLRKHQVNKHYFRNLGPAVVIIPEFATSNCHEKTSHTVEQMTTTTDSTNQLSDEDDNVKITKIILRNETHGIFLHHVLNEENECTAKSDMNNQQFSLPTAQNIKTGPCIPGETNDKMINGEIKSALVADKFEDVNTLALDIDMQSDEVNHTFLQPKIEIIKTEPYTSRESNSKMIDEKIKGAFIIGKHEEVNNLVHDSDMQKIEITHQYPNITCQKTKNNLIETSSEEVYVENDTHDIIVEDQSFIASKIHIKNNDEPTNNTSLKKKLCNCVHENSKEDNNDADRLFLLSLLPQIKQVPLSKKNELYIHILKDIQQFIQ